MGQAGLFAREHSFEIRNGGLYEAAFQTVEVLLLMAKGFACWKKIDCGDQRAKMGIPGVHARVRGLSPAARETSLGMSRSGCHTHPSVPQEEGAAGILRPGTANLESNGGSWRLLNWRGAGISEAKRGWGGGAFIKGR